MAFLFEALFFNEVSLSTSLSINDEADGLALDGK
jgi:hypothetical protein